MKYGSETPIAAPPIISRNPYPYPKDIPATHMEGVEGKRKVGKSATEPKTKTARTGGLNVFVSQFNIGMIS
nr:hypothetical protein Itr_chr13CG18440 [Ipomoea trifida]